MRTSEDLEPGVVYTRAVLRQRYGITDKTLDTGIFKPPDHDSIWLFVTEKKKRGSIQYTDKLEGNTLTWQSQASGRRDQMLIQHEALGLEVLLFYRRTPNRFGNYGFQYEGPIQYISSDKEQPRKFVFERDPTIGTIVTAARDIAELAREEMIGEEGASSKLLVNHHERNPRLRAEAVRIHGTTCQACGFSFAERYGSRGCGFIEVHHKVPLSHYHAGSQVNPKTDMAVLCSNCHRMVHRDQDDPLTLDALRSLLVDTPISEQDSRKA